MFIEIRNIPQGKTVQKCVLLLPEELATAGGVKPEVDASLEIRRLDETLFVELHYQGVAKRVCDRCLNSFTQNLLGSVSFILQHKDSEEDYTEGDSDCYVYEQEEDEIDFSQTLYDDMMLSMGVKSMCKEDCEGLSSPLTPEAEEETKSEEKEKPVDPRWAALGKLKK